MRRCPPPLFFLFHYPYWHQSAVHQFECSCKKCKRILLMWPGMKCTASLLGSRFKHISISFYQAKRPRRGTLSAAGTPIFVQRKCVFCCRTWESACSPLDELALRYTTLVTSRKSSFVVPFCCLLSGRHCTTIFTEFPTSHTTITKYFETHNFDTSYGQHSLALCAHFSIFFFVILCMRAFRKRMGGYLQFFSDFE